MKHDLSVFIGRFQPFHLSHKLIVDHALKISNKVLVIIGSSFEPSSFRNPWSFEEREAMVRSCFTDEQNKNIICEPLRDIRYNNSLWISEVQRLVYDICPEDASITLIGRKGSGKAYYPSLFPNWSHEAIDHDLDIEGTLIRSHIFSDCDVKELGDDVPNTVRAFIEEFIALDQGKDLIEEYDFIQKYKKGWESVPFSPTHVTVDTVVVQSGHVLLVERGARPGKGLLALPGGFVDHEEKLIDAAVRKLKEEAKLKVPAPVIVGSVKNKAVFDDPFRSARGRTITYAFHIELRSEEELPKVKGGGETRRCFWQPLGLLDSSEMFEDHYFIIQKMLGMA